MEDKNLKNWWLYVLELEEGKYYVGITSQTPEIRMQEHINHVRAAYWTIKYRPLKLIYKQNLGQISKENAEIIETLKTQELMKQYGINNVRGGNLTDADDDYILRFNRYFKLDDWEVITVITMQSIAIIILLLDKYGIL